MTTLSMAWPAEFLGALLASAVLGWFLLWLELIPWRKTARAHWTEQARALFPARVAGLINPWLIPICFAGVAHILRPDWHLSAVLAGAVLGALLGSYPIDREVQPTLTFRMWLRLVAVSVVFRLLRWGLFLAAVVFMPRNFGGLTWTIASAFLALQLALQFGLGLRLMRLCGVLRPAPIRLTTIVAGASTTTGIPVRAVWEIVLSQANALAYVTTKELGFTSKLLEICTDEEIQAICFHELAHLAESNLVLAGRVVASLAIFPLVFFNPVAAEFGPGAPLVLVLLAGMLWWMRGPLSRRMEDEADRVAINATTSEGVYATALEKIHRENLFPAVQRNSRHTTHPNLYDRMIAAKLLPEYPRPQPPPSRSWSVTVLMAVSFYTSICILLQSQ